MYIFRIYYKVSGAKRRRGIELSIPGWYDLADAWDSALRWAIAYTLNDEVINSIQFIGREDNDNER